MSKPPFLPTGDIEAVTTVAAFLVHAEAENPDMMFGSWTAAEAVEGLAHMLSVNVSRLRAIGSIKHREAGAGPLESKPGERRA